MSIIEIFDKPEWPCSKSFLQSWEWGEFQASVGNTPRRFLVNDKPVQIFVHRLLVGVFWYIPQADLAVTDYELLVEFVKKENKIVFIRIESLSALPTLSSQAKVVKHRQPEHSLILDLNKKEEDLLTQMHSKTRYNIRLAEKKNLIISWEKNAIVFNQLLTETSRRDKFGAHNNDYYEKMLKCNLTEQVTVYLDDEPLASAIFIEYGETYTYLHGASANAHRETMAPYLLQWSAILRAQEKGFKIYDFWGVAPENAEADHPWSGITRFKSGFGGTRLTHGQAFELPIRKLPYKIFLFLKIFLNILKNSK